MASTRPSVSAPVCVVVRTLWISSVSGTATSSGHVASNKFVTWSATSADPKKPAKEVRTMKKGNMAISTESAM